MDNLLLFGGSFDPIHNGHLNTAINVQNNFNFQRFIFLPCKTPLLKHNTLATPAQRITMLKLAIAEHPDYDFEIDEREITRDSPSFTTTTLKDFRNEYGNDISITLMMGHDTFRQLPAWHQWQQLLTLANILVINRPGESNLSEEMKIFSEQYSVSNKTQLLTHTHGVIYHFNAGHYDLSSTLIRQKIKDGSNDLTLLPPSVDDYIKQLNLYK